MTAANWRRGAVAASHGSCSGSCRTQWRCPKGCLRAWRFFWFEGRWASWLLISSAEGQPCSGMLHKQATICCNNKNAWQWICCGCQYGWPGTQHTYYFIELIWEHRRLLGMLPYIAALYGQNSCGRVLLFRGWGEGIKRVLTARLFQSPLGLWFQPFPDLSFKLYFAHRVPLSGGPARHTSPSHHHNSDSKKHVSSLVLSSVSSRDAYVNSFEVPISPGFHVLITPHYKEVDDSPHSQCPPLGPPLSEWVLAWATSGWGCFGCHPWSNNPSVTFLLRLSVGVSVQLFVAPTATT